MKSGDATWVEDQTTGATLESAGVPDIIAGRYEILGMIGVGGMGSVYRARDSELDEVIAIKLLHSDRVGTVGALSRFRQEVKLARRVTHKNVVRTFDLGETNTEAGPLRYLTMAYVEGPSLGKRLAEQGFLPIDLVVHFGTGIADAIAAAHGAGVLHRDLKPDNVLIATAEDGEFAMITDFGIASSSDRPHERFIAGTPGYMSPEQRSGTLVGPAADIFAIGAILFEMLSGQRAFMADGTPTGDISTLRANTPVALSGLIQRCLSNDRPTASALAAALRAVPKADAPATEAPKALPALPRTSAVSIAVLPFRFVGPSSDEYLATGFSEELLDHLSASPSLRVRPLRTIEAGADPRELGRTLGVQVVVDGSVRRVGDQLRLVARLISVAEGFQLWSKRVDATPEHLLDESQVIARQIAEALTVHLEARHRGTVADPANVDLYLRAKAIIARTWNSDPLPAEALLDQALAREPDQPLFLATQAVVQARIAFLGGAVDREARMAAAQRHAERATALAPDLGDPWVALATVRLHEGDALTAAKHLHRAVTLTPGLIRGQELVASLLLECGAFAAAQVRFEAVLASDPLSTSSSRWELARLHALMGNWAACDALIDSPTSDPMVMAGGVLSLTRYAMWDPKRPLPAVPPEIPRVHLAAPILAFRYLVESVRAGNPIRQQERDMLRTIEDAPRLRAVRMQLAAELAAFAGELDLAFWCLDAAIESSLFDLGWMDLCPPLAPMRADPRWKPAYAIIKTRAFAVRAALDGAS